jgi:UDP-glucose 4-epimerase
MMSFRSALVTGATGSIGSVLVHRLCRKKVDVTCLVRSKARVVGLNQMPGVRMVEASSFNQDELASKLANLSAEVVFNLASYGVQPADRDPERLVEGNVNILTALMRAVSKWKVKRFVHAGSCSEYSPSSAHGVLLDEHHPLRPVSPYGVAKAEAFLSGNSLAHSLEIPFLTLRLFGVFGPHEAPTRLIPYLIRRLSVGQPVDLTPGEQVRDLLFEDDVAEALVEAADAEGLDFCQAYNVCSSLPVTVRSVAELVADKLHRPHDLLHWGERPYRLDEPMWLVGDNRRFVQATLWRPRIGLEEGIERMIVAARVSTR